MVKYFFNIILFSLTYFAVYAQQKPDIQLRIAPEISYNITKKLKLSAGFRTSFINNISSFQRNNIEVSLDYDLPKKFNIGIGYRYSTSYSNDYHRLFAYLKYNYKINKKFSIEPSIKYQFQTDFFDSEYMQFYKAGKHTLRPKITFNYNIPKSKFDISFAPELFLRFYNHQTLAHRMRYSLGADYSFKYGNKLGILFFYDDYLKASSQDRFVTTIKYKLDLSELIKKIKKKSHKK